MGIRPSLMSKGTLEKRAGMRSTRPAVMAWAETHPEKKVFKRYLWDSSALYDTASPKLTKLNQGQVFQIIALGVHERVDKGSGFGGSRTDKNVHARRNLGQHFIRGYATCFPGRFFFPEHGGRYCFSFLMLSRANSMVGSIFKAIS